MPHLKNLVLNLGKSSTGWVQLISCIRCRFVKLTCIKNKYLSELDFNRQTRFSHFDPFLSNPTCLAPPAYCLCSNTLQAFISFPPSLSRISSFQDGIPFPLSQFLIHDLLCHQFKSNFTFFSQISHSLNLSI